MQRRRGGPHVRPHPGDPCPRARLAALPLAARVRRELLHRVAPRRRDGRRSRFAVAGDSLTAWDDQTFPEPDGELDPVTWTHWVIADGLELAGGYARGFATARDIADSMVAVDADVLVVMVGTNDTGVTDTDAVLASIDDIVATAGARRC